MWYCDEGKCWVGWPVSGAALWQLKEVILLSFLPLCFNPCLADLVQIARESSTFMSLPKSFSLSLVA